MQALVFLDDFILSLAQGELGKKVMIFQFFSLKNCAKLAAAKVLAFLDFSLPEDFLVFSVIFYLPQRNTNHLILIYYNKKHYILILPLKKYLF